ncbi:3-dehydroquinate synthase [Camelimonas fluminis]|uniref:3-dehydroquinate synthase n=1 Tax=Camelimonas fluminis TaxID=1576911 RepID=A0ABV7UHZ6_9HYPH|nr:3-dehydroquinate synthase [Camelimonas fluminis]GHE63303.1 3-dehydroquinate synthase [Camelimonas fluminis]
MTTAASAAAAQAKTAGSSTGERVIRVALAERSYDIRIGRGLLDGLGDAVARLAPGANVAIVTDENVNRELGERARASLAQAGLRVDAIVLPPGEATKSWRHVEQVCEALLAAKIERGDIVVALGGGVIGDLTGFAAAILRRGVRFVQVPTSLLAQVDSSVGGKTGVNSPHGKNLIGAFYQPSLVLADTAALDSLPAREFRAGYAEVAKYGLIDQPEFFAWCEQNWNAVYSGTEAREYAVATSCAAKAAVVARDETETGDRALLNLGHTFGHALERLTQYDSARLVHGEGVAIGMAQAFRFSARLGLCAPADADRVARHLAAAGLPVHPTQIPGGVGTVDEVLEAMAQDKKVSRGALTFILARGIGQSFIAKNVPRDDVRAFLEADMAGGPDV